MRHLLDVLFCFPDSAGATPVFVMSVLNSLTLPVMVVDRKMKVHLVNLQGQDMLFRFADDAKRESKAAGPKRAGNIFPKSMRNSIRACVKGGRTGLVGDFTAPGLRSNRYDLVLCPGCIQGTQFCFLLMSPHRAGLQFDAASATEVVLENMNGAALWLDSEVRVKAFNKRYLSEFKLSSDEAMGATITELNPSEQAGILEAQIRHLMSANEVRNAQADTLTTHRRGILVVSILAWPLRNESDGCEGLFVIAQPASGSAPLALLDEKTIDLFGRTAVEQGPPMFFTHLDGKIITMNVSAKAMLRMDKQTGASDIKTAVPWVRPELISRLYQDLLAGTNSSVFLTDIETGAGKRIFMVQARGIKEVGDITSTVLINLRDVTEIEHSRDLLGEAARRLATEREILSRVMSNLQNIRLAYAVVDRELNIIRVSDSVISDFGKPASFFLGRKAYEIDPSTRTSGIIAYLKTAMERGQSISAEKFRYRIPGGGEVLLSLGFHPMKVDGEQACLIAVENLTDKEARESELQKSSRRLRSLLDNMQAGVAVLDKNGSILDVNHVIYGAVGMTREEMIGKNEREVMAVEEGDLLMDFRRRAIRTRQPVSTGCIKLTSKIREGAVFVDISYIPLFSGDGVVEETLAIVRYLTDVVNLEKKVEEYTDNLGRLARERTRELTSVNAELETTVDKLASLAQSGLVLSSLKDMDSVIDAFLSEAREVLAADFVSVALISSTNGSSRTTYYSAGKTPPDGAIPSEIIEQSLARLTLGGERKPPVKPDGKQLLVHDFAFSGFSGLLLAWRETGEFSAIDGNLIRVLCTQLSFSLPITSYVGDLRSERDRSGCLRRIAFRTAGAKLVGSAIGIVAEELSKVMVVDRFYWLVFKNDDNIWLSLVPAISGRDINGRAHLSGEEAASLTPVLNACRESHKMFSDRFADFGVGDFRVGRCMLPAEPCSFADSRACKDLVGCLKKILRGRDLIHKNEGSLALAPVVLSERSYGLLCAYNEMGLPFKPDESCFMCLAASTVSHMWQAADASSSIRRLEAEGEALSEIAHDLKYPLMRVRDLLERTRSGRKADKKDMAALGEIDSEIRTLNLLVEEFIDISNRKEKQPEILDVRDIVDRCIRLVSQDAHDRGIEVSRVTDSSPAPAFANSKDVKNILISVLANCVEAVGSSGWVEVAVGLEDSGLPRGCVNVVVIDSGPGVPEDLLGRIFDPFYTTKSVGRGLGLFSAKKRANANGGDVFCEWGNDGQTRFVISLPLASG